MRIKKLDVDPMISAAAAMMGRRSKGVKKTLTDERRNSLRKWVAELRERRVRKRAARKAALAEDKNFVREMAEQGIFVPVKGRPSGQEVMAPDDASA